MKTRENLDAYQGAYGPGFRFFEENQWYLNHYAERISQVIESSPIRSILSLGIGHQAVSGRIMEHLGQSLEQYHILEGSEDIIRHFRARADLPRGVVTVHTYFENFETNDWFDAIEMGFILEHVDDPELIVRKYREFLRPGGVMFIAVPNARSLHRLIGHYAGLLDDVFRLSPQDHELGHKRYFDLQSVSDLVTRAGLHITRRQGLMLKPITVAQIQQLGWGQGIIQALMRIGDDYPEIANCILLEASR